MAAASSAWLFHLHSCCLSLAPLSVLVLADARGILRLTPTMEGRIRHFAGTDGASSRRSWQRHGSAVMLRRQTARTLAVPSIAHLPASPPFSMIRWTEGLSGLHSVVLWYEGYGVAMCGASYSCQMPHSVRPVHLRAFLESLRAIRRLHISHKHRGSRRLRPPRSGDRGASPNHAYNDVIQTPSDGTRGSCSGGWFAGCPDRTYISGFLRAGPPDHAAPPYCALPRCWHQRRCSPLRASSRPV